MYFFLTDPSHHKKYYRSRPKYATLAENRRPGQIFLRPGQRVELTERLGRHLAAWLVLYRLYAITITH